MKKILAVLFLFKCITCIFALGFEERINGSKWLAEYYNTVLEKQDHNVLLDFIPKFNEEPFIFHYEKDEGFYWYEDEYLQYGVLRISKSNIDNDIILNIQEYPFTMLKTNEIEKDCYEIIVEKKFVKQSSSDAAALWGGNVSKIVGKEIEKLFFKFDGDYLYIYLDDNETLFTIYYAYSNEEYLIIRESIKTNSFNMSKITWPRHADGTCDYEDTSMSKTAEPAEVTALPETAVSKPAPAMGKTATVTENLRLRTDDKTTAQVVAMLAAGTRVKVLAPGREYTIDGIASNWVQVEVLGGANDKDGNAIEAGTVGWLFGGYLSEAEEFAENERANVKESSALPIVPIVAGVAVLAVLIVVILLAAKKRKSSKE